MTAQKKAGLSKATETANLIQAIDATPRKEMLVAAATAFELDTALCELIDNIYDAWLSRNKTAWHDGKSNTQIPLTVHIEIKRDSTGDSIVVSDNSGGIGPDLYEALVTPGATTHTPESGKGLIGSFGLGFKLAIFSRGRDIRITTRKEDQRAVEIRFDESWLKTSDWTVNVYEMPASTLAPGETRVEIRNLTTPHRPETEPRLIEHLGHVYGPIILQQEQEGKRFEILVNSKRVNPIVFPQPERDPDENWCYFPGMEPATHHHLFETNDGRMVDAWIQVGFTAAGDSAEYGVYAYGNSRQFVRALHDESIGFTNEELGRPHPELQRLRAYVFFSGFGRDIPWNSTKNGFNTRNPIFFKLRQALIRHLKPYARFVENGPRGGVFLQYSPSHPPGKDKIYPTRLDQFNWLDNDPIDMIPDQPRFSEKRAVRLKRKLKNLPVGAGVSDEEAVSGPEGVAQQPVVVSFILPKERWDMLVSLTRVTEKGRGLMKKVMTGVVEYYVENHTGSLGRLKGKVPARDRR